MVVPPWDIHTILQAISSATLFTDENNVFQMGAAAHDAGRVVCVPIWKCQGCN